MLDLDQLLTPVSAAKQLFSSQRNYSAKLKHAMGYTAHWYGSSANVDFKPSYLIQAIIKRLHGFAVHLDSM